MFKNNLNDFYNNSIVMLLLIFSAFPILPRVAESIILMVVLFFSIVFFIFQDKNKRTASKTKTFFGVTIFFWVYLFTLFYTDNIGYGLSNIKIMLPIVVLPIIFLINKEVLLLNKHIDKFILIYVLSILFYLFYLNIFIYKTLFIRDLDIVVVRDIFEKATKVHGTYFSMWIGFAVILLLFKIQEHKLNIIFVLIAFLTILFFIYWQSIIAARMPLAVTLLFIILFLLKKNTKLLILLLATIASTFFIMPKNMVFVERFEKIKNYDFTFPKGKYETNWQNISNEQIRNGIYYCTYQKIKEAPIFGHGVGDADTELQKCYDIEFTDTNTYKLLKYNSHNQYLDFILVSGLIGLIIILFFQFKIIKIALKNKNTIYLYFIIYFILNITFENVLNRHDGVMFFSFFNTILFFQIYNKNEESINS